MAGLRAAIRLLHADYSVHVCDKPGVESFRDVGCFCRSALLGKSL